jgi:pimeloyl-ACP methyl ester carboxylesterase
MVDIIPDSRWLECPESGHVVYLERPDVFFLRAVAGGWGAA